MGGGHSSGASIKVDLDNINIDKLRELDEEPLRKNIIIPLLNYIEVQNVVDMHGSREEGIDIYFETFDIFGNTVNSAARYQTMCDPMQINIPESMKDVLQDKYKIVERLPRKVKGKGLMPMYYLHNPLPTINIPKKEDILHTNKLCLMY